MLVETKISRPKVPEGIVRRAVLLEALSNLWKKPLTLLVAPPGYGKTTLAASWTASQPVRQAWFSLDKTDNDAASFWRGICAALGRVGERFTKVVWPSFAPFDSSGIQHGIEVLIKELIDYSRRWHADGDILLVLDDFHEISDLKLQEQFSQFLDYCPEGLHILLLSRSVPRIDLPRRRVRHQVFELPAALMRFSLEDAKEFLQYRLHLELNDGQVKQLHDRTEGWVAALQLAGMAMANGEGVTEEMPQLSGRHHLLSDYLLAEVFQKQEDEIRAFLIQAAQFSRFSAELLDAAFPNVSCPRLLEECLARSLLLQPLDEDGHWFRFHDLFREWLQASEEFRRFQQDDSCRQAVSRAAAWFEVEGFSLDALRLLVENQQWEAAVALVARAMGEWFYRGEISRAIQLLEFFPSEWSETAPFLQLLHGMHWFNHGDFHQARLYLSKFESLISQEELEAGLSVEAAEMMEVSERIALPVLLDFFRGQIARYSGHLEEAKEYSRRLQNHNVPAGSAFQCWILEGVGADAFIDGELELAKVSLFRAYELAEKRRDIFCLFVICSHLVPVLVHIGELALSKRYLDRLQDLMGPHWQDHPLSPLLLKQRAFISREAYQLDDARRYINKAIVLGIYDCANIDVIYFEFLNWLLALLEGDQGLGRRIITSIESRHARSGEDWPYVTPGPEILRIVEDSYRGRFDSLINWMQAHEYDDFQGPFLLVSMQKMLWIRAQFLIGASPFEELYALRRTLEKKGVLLRVLKTWLVEAQVHYFRQNNEGAIQCMEQVLLMTSRYQFVCTVLEEGPWIEALLRLGFPQEETRQEASRLLAILAPEEGKESFTVAGNAQAAKPVEPLSRRELELLSLVSEGHSNKSLAEQLNISISTVKTHLSNIYGKLQAQNRTQALAIARECRLLT